MSLWSWFAPWSQSSPRVRRSRRHSQSLGPQVVEQRQLMTADLSTTAWTAVGPASIAGEGFSGGNAAGRITGIAAHPTNANTIYIAAAGGGVWKTTDAGGHWSPLTDTQSTLAMGAIALAPTNPSVIYAGTGEANNSGDSQAGKGILISSDGGSSWTLTGQSQFDGMVISKIAVDPTNANVAFAAASSLQGGTAGIYKTTNRGSTWTAVKSDSSTQFSDVSIDPTNSQIVFAAQGAWWGASSNGIYKSTDGGGSWNPAGNFPGGSSAGRITLAIAPSSHNTIYASISNPSTHGLAKMMKSIDGGSTWLQLFSTPNYMGSQGWYDQSLAVSPTNANVVFAGGSYSYGGGSPNGLIESTNGGVTWTEIGTQGLTGIGTHPDHHAAVFDANGKLLDGDDGGIFRLDDPNTSGWTWSDLNSDLNITQFTGIALHPTNPDIAYGGSQDNGTEKYTGNLEWDMVRGGDGGFVRVDPNNPNTIYHTFYYSGDGFLERSDNGGASWNGKTTGIDTDDADLPDEEDPAHFYPPFIIDPANSNRLLLGTNRVYESTNKGDSWTPISTPGSGTWTTSSPIDSIGARGNTVYAAAGGHIYITTNDGVSWAETTPTSATFDDIWVNPANGQTAYTITGDAFSSGHVFKTTNGGGTWTDISGDIPDLAGHAIRVDTVTGTIYAGMDDGVYSSTNGGTHWARSGTGMPNVQVVGLDLNPTTLILGAATHGRGMWELALDHGGPVLSNISGNVNWTAAANPTILASTATVTDTGNPLANSVLSVRATNGNTSDRVSIVAGNGVTVSGSTVSVGGTAAGAFTGGSGSTALVVTFNAGATEARIESVMRQIGFSSVSNAPPLFARTVSFQITDGASITGTAASMTAQVSNTPAIGALGGNVTFQARSKGVVLAAQATANDGGGNFAGSTLTVQLTNGDALDRLGIAVGNGVKLKHGNLKVNRVLVGTVSGGTGQTALTIHFNNLASQTAVETILRRIAFVNSSPSPATFSRTVTFQLIDGTSAASAVVSKSILVTVPASPSRTAKHSHAHA